MATLTLFVCPPGQTHVDTVPLSTNEYGTCAQGQGSFQNVEIAETFDPSTLNTANLAGAWSAGFIVMATGLVIMAAFRKLIDVIKS